MAKGRILIVDDQPDITDMLSRVMSTAGFEPVVAHNGNDAIIAVLAHKPDLVLLDVSMPGIDGFAVATMLKSDPATSSIPIIMVSAQVGRGARVIGLESGAEDYLTKPVDTAELLLKVRNLLRLRKRTAARATEAAKASPSP